MGTLVWRGSATEASLQFVRLRNAAGQKPKHKLSLACYHIKLPAEHTHSQYLSRAQSSYLLPIPPIKTLHRNSAACLRKSLQKVSCARPYHFTSCLTHRGQEYKLALCRSRTDDANAALIVLWAQRSSKDDAEKNYIFLTISVPDVPSKSLKLDLKPTGLTFTGTSESKKTTYHLDIEFYEVIDVENSKTNHSPKNIEIVLRKKELKEEYWPRLLKDKAKVHFLRTDFDKVCISTNSFTSLRL